jgi:hypothetical protein
MTRAEITQHVDNAIATQKSWSIVVQRQTGYSSNPVRFEVCLNSNPNIVKMVFGVSALSNYFGYRDFNANINKSYDSKEQFVSAIVRALRNEPKASVKS